MTLKQPSRKKEPMKKRFDYSIWLMWIVANVLGWSINLGVGVRWPAIYNQAHIGVFACLLAMLGLFTGLFSGLFMYLLLGKRLKLSFRWILVCALSYLVSLPLAFLIEMFYFEMALGLPPVTGSSTIILSMPVFMIMILAGALVGFSQTWAGELAYWMNNRREKLLWTAGSTLGWGLGFFAAMFVQPGNSLAQSLVCGLFIGVIEGGILMVVMPGEQSQAASL